MSRECPTKKSGTKCYNCNEEGRSSLGLKIFKMELFFEYIEQSVFYEFFLAAVSIKFKKL